MTDARQAPAFLIAAPASGSGKTTVTLSVLRALNRRGLEIGSFKTGHDYIDPAFHTAASGHDCFNIDPWAMSDDTISAALDMVGTGKDIVVGEAVMGLFDGARDGTGSSADLAHKLDIPIILVVDAKGQAASVGALLHGFNSFRPEIALAGVIFNNVGGPGHRAMLEAAAQKIGIPSIGCLPRHSELALEHRHLGLIQARENPELDQFLETAADLAEGHLDLDTLVSLGRPAARPKTSRSLQHPPAQQIAIARDDAFAFLYPHLLNAWRQAGADISFFSPLKDEAPDQNAEFIYLPGGYPELHAEALSNAETFRQGMRHAAAQNTPIYGECGGYMTLGRALTDKSGIRYSMLDLLPVETSFATPRLHLGYRKARLAVDCILGKPGDIFKAHEFHYATILSEDNGQSLFTLTDAIGKELPPAGLVQGSVAGSFIHLIDGESF